ncbi:MAG: class I SAM-dependent methyltransferase [Chloroflexi bacterium]|nr:class I SAM-dependent methyltransferase [Chloroflexota bacterium]
MEKNQEEIKQNLADFYDSTAVEYHDSHYQRKGRYSPLQYRQHYVEKMIEAQQVPPGAKVLDIGCGPGELSLNLLKKGYDVWAVDISQSMVDEAVAVVNTNGYPEWKQAHVGDIEGIEFQDESFDVVVAAGVIEYQKDDENSLGEMRRVLKPDGYMILNVTNRYSPIRILSAPYTWMTKQSIGRSVLNVLKTRVLGRGQLSSLPAIRSHSSRAFDKKLSNFGFEKVNYNYFAFSPLPSPLCPLFGRICGPMGRWMEKLTRSPLGFLGGGYIVIARKLR